MRIVGFAGPSRPRSRHRLPVPVDWHGPAGRGDLDRLAAGSGDHVLLIDGLVVRGYAPSPTECARLISRGATLWGASSIGAIRAVELAPLGMRGYGWVYARLRDRSITWDDELVAVLDSRTHRATTVFLANVRYGLERANRRNLVTGELADRLLLDLRAIHFSERSAAAVEGVLARRGVPRSLWETLLGPGADIKRIDAAGLVRQLSLAIGKSL
jgi:hypothetical protein